MGALAFEQRFEPEMERDLSVLVLDDDSFDRKRMRRWLDRSLSGNTIVIGTTLQIPSN